MKRHGSSFEIVSFTEGSYSVLQVKNLAGSETPGRVWASPASRRLAAHLYGRAICDGIRSIRAAPDLPPISVADREMNPKRRTLTDFRNRFDPPSMRPRDASHRRQSQAGAAFGGREEGIENALQVVFADASSGVGYFNDCLFAGLVRFKPLNAHGNPSFAFNRFDGVDHQIEDRIFNLCGIGVHDDIFFR